MPPSSEICRSTRLELPERREGKVRDCYTWGEGTLLLVTTDRLSAFDRVLGYVPFKGQVLNQLSNWWFGRCRDIVANHVLEEIDPNAIVARQARPLSVEVVVRGYITGVTETSLWRRYELGEREIYGYALPEGLGKNQLLPEPLITPTTKGGPTGHDERLTPAQVVEQGHVPPDLWDEVTRAALALFARGQQVARERGLLLVDTKYEFGTADGELLLIDEVHTPDSSRYWRLASYAERLSQGLEPESLDKEFVRLAYASLGYRGEGEPPQIPNEIWQQASVLYREVYETLTGHSFRPAPGSVQERLKDLVTGRT